MKYEGKTLKRGEISEWAYEHFIDVAYGRGANLKDTKLWKPGYVRGFVCPDDNGGYFAFAYDGEKHLYLGDFKHSQVFEDEGEDKYDKEERMLREADRSNVIEAIDILRSLYLDPDFKELTTPEGMKIAGDPDCIKWMSDYWNYVKWNEHGNECSISEVRFEGFCEDLIDPSNAIEYLMPDGPKYADDTAKELAERLTRLNKKHFGKRKVAG